MIQGSIFLFCDRFVVNRSFLVVNCGFFGLVFHVFECESLKKWIASVDYYVSFVFFVFFLFVLCTFRILSPVFHTVNTLIFLFLLSFVFLFDMIDSY